jgi:mRNA-decapping enzyme subunit 2
MDEVVLVKGWKKSANWSFPRGKINQDENDLDCAVREVYEETGFNAREAGLVKDEKDMKYIEITMREQHMRLYVFRGVPRDAHFEPKTRKEISKIEWYKLTDLPTLKKSRQHEGSGTDHTSINANKFYMVAPFLNPLKKWIAQQRKKDNRYSSHLAAPPMVAEELTTEEERDQYAMGVRIHDASSRAISDLPEVSTGPAPDRTSQIKEMLHIGMPATQPQLLQEPSHMPQVDAQKSNALLALLRGDQSSLPIAASHTPEEQFSMRPGMHEPVYVSRERPQQLAPVSPAPTARATQPQAQASLLSLFQHPRETAAPPNQSQYPQPAPPIAPYQRIGDPLSVPQGAAPPGQTAVPPASALPKLTNHTKALLDVFKASSSSGTPQTADSAPMPDARSSSSKSLLDIFKGVPSTQNTTGLPFQKRIPHSAVESLPQTGLRVQNASNPLELPGLVSYRDAVAFQPATSTTSQSAVGTGNAAHVLSQTTATQRPEVQKNSLLQLFSQPAAPKTGTRFSEPPAPVELAATSAHTPMPAADGSQDEFLLALLRQGKQAERPKETGGRRTQPREGETAATVNGPLNQPDFNIMAKAARSASGDMGRSPLTTNRTLFDPNAPASIKILARPGESRPPPPRSPREIKSSKRSTREKTTAREVAKEPAKPFQPQILRRPQPGEEVTPDLAPKTIQTPVVDSMPESDADTLERSVSSRKASHSEAQKQKLLALFGGGLDTTPKAPPVQSGSGIVSPLTASQTIAAGGDGGAGGIDAISTRTSRVGSMASVMSGPGVGRAGSVEKRQTGAENKAFLLGYLGRIASQEK